MKTLGGEAGNEEAEEFEIQFFIKDTMEFVKDMMEFIRVYKATQNTVVAIPDCFM